MCPEHEIEARADLGTLPGCIGRDRTPEPSPSRPALVKGRTGFPSLSAPGAGEGLRSPRAQVQERVGEVPPAKIRRRGGYWPRDTLDQAYPKVLARPLGAYLGERKISYSRVGRVVHLLTTAVYKTRAAGQTPGEQRHKRGVIINLLN